MRRLRREPHRFPYQQRSLLREMRTCEHDLVAARSRSASRPYLR
jgi:hypothetical protein